MEPEEIEPSEQVEASVKEDSKQGANKKTVPKPEEAPPRDWY